MKPQRIRLLRARVQAIAAEVAAAAEQGQTLTFDPDDAPCECGTSRRGHEGADNRGRVRDPDNPAGPPRCVRYRADQLEIDARTAYRGMTNRYGDDLRAYERIQNAAHVRAKARRGDGKSVRPSDLGSCGHAIGLRLIPPDDLFTNITDGRPARMGGAIHRDRAQVVRDLYPWRRSEVPFKLPNLDSTFFVDEHDPVTGDVFETKTAGEYRWRVTMEDGAAEYWVDQALVGALGLHLAGAHVTRVRILVIQRADGHDVEFVIPWDDLAQEMARDALGRLLALQTAIIDLGEIPDRDRSGPSTDIVCRSYCPFRDYCWQIPRATELGVSGESLIMLGEEPSDEKVVWALRQVVEAAKARRDADELFKERKSWVAGREHRAYPGDDGYEYVIADGRTATPKWKAWRDAVMEWEKLPEDQRPPLESIPVPKGEPGEFEVRRRIQKNTRPARKPATAPAEQPEQPEQVEQVEQQDQPAETAGAA